MHAIAYEPIEIESGGAVWFAFAMIILLLGSSLIIWELQRSFLTLWGKTQPPLLRPISPGPKIPPLVTEPPLQGTPFYQVYGPAEVAALRQSDERRLHTFGFYDRDQGLVHIPIGLAMQLLVARGRASQEERP